VADYLGDDRRRTQRQIILPDPGQVGRTPRLEVVEDPAQQFRAAWDNLCSALAPGGRRLHLRRRGRDDHRPRRLARAHAGVPRSEDSVFPRGTCAWACIGVSELAHPGLLVEIKCVAVARGTLPSAAA
jgi:enamine deaminase RidA (YjgF/YER057c/UK114 family)